MLKLADEAKRCEAPYMALRFSKCCHIAACEHFCSLACSLIAATNFWSLNRMEISLKISSLDMLIGSFVYIPFSYKDNKVLE